MTVAAGPDEVTHLQVRLLGHHLGEQRVGGNVERHTQEDVGAALVHLAREPAFSHVELEERVAGLQGHAVEVRDVPGAHDEAARVRVAGELLQHAADLVYVTAVRRGPGTPLVAVLPQPSKYRNYCQYHLLPRSNLTSILAA